MARRTEAQGPIPTSDVPQAVTPRGHGIAYEIHRPRRTETSQPAAIAPDATPSSAPARCLTDLDEKSRGWLKRLSSTEAERADAEATLFDLLHRAAHREAERRRGRLPARVLADLDDICRQAADDAVAAVMRKLGEFRGASRFTTWAYKFVVFELSATLRHEAWRGRTIELGDEAWGQLADAAPLDPAAETEAQALITAVQKSLDADLTPWQREVFTLVVVLDVPIHVVAERHAKLPGAIYKVLHDARRKIRASLEAQGWYG